MRETRDVNGNVRWDSQGAFGDGYVITRVENPGCDPGRLAIMFSGQGSAKPGMFLDLYQRVQVVR
ncbi:MAG TPA: hypothetical protein PKO06_17270, partial [Candidatus Ozemobacteraceae bacterium]|nr:hypothetical protein [Candidatus Ozemobacteraceae bacterium]